MGKSTMPELSDILVISIYEERRCEEGHST